MFPVRDAVSPGPANVSKKNAGTSGREKSRDTLLDILVTIVRRGDLMLSKRCFRIISVFLLLVGAGAVPMSCATAERSQLAIVEEGDFTPVIDDIEMLKVGDKAPLFEVSDVYGNRVDFGDKVGKNVIVLVFWSVYCDPCRNSMPTFDEVYRKYRKKGLEFFTINMDGEEMANAIRAFLDDEGLELTVLLDEPAGDFLKIADPYGVQGTPTIYIINKKGRIAFAKVGTISYENLSAVVREELRKR